MMKARTARWVAIPSGVVVAAGLSFAALMYFWTHPTTSSWALPDGYTLDLQGRMLTLYDWGGDCDQPLTADVVAQDEHTVTVAVMRHVKPGDCDSAAVLHQVDVWLAAPLRDREVLDRSGRAIPGRASRGDALGYGALQHP